jgi:phosphomannomutase/phosphoglucomutase
LSTRAKGKGAASAGRGEARRNPSAIAPAPGVRAYWIRGLLGSALVLLVAALLTLALVAKRESSRDLRHLAGAARLLAQEIVTELARARDLLESASTDAALQGALGSPRPEALRERELELQTRFPSALAAHLFQAEQTTSVEGIPFMSYAGLDLARQAAQERRVTQVEVHKVGQPDMHLAIAGPVFDVKRDRVLGVIHLALPMSLLPTLESPLLGLGTAAYRQVVGGHAVAIDSTSPSPEGEPDQAAEIPGTRLQLVVWLAPRGLPDAQLLGAVAAVYLASLGLIGVLLWFGHRLLRRDLLEDSQGFVLMVQDALQQRPLRRVQSRTAEIQRAHLDVATQLRALGSAPSPRGGHARPSAASSVGTPIARTPASPSAPLGGAHSVESTGLAGLDDSAEWDASDELDELDELELPDPFASDAAAPVPSEPALPPRPKGEPRVASAALAQVPESIFRAYDIRGLVGRQLTGDTLQAIGRALGSAAVAEGDHTVVIGRDCRPSSPELCAALAAGIRSAGPDVVDIGVVPAPLVYFACCHPERHAGAIVTGSHNPPEYNGVKPVLAGRSVDAEAIQALRRRIETGDLATGNGDYRRLDLIPQYREYIERDVALARDLKVILDCGNATASAVAPALYRALGCEVVERRCDLGAGMGETMPDPSVPELLRPLGDLVVAEGADLGLAFDGDGDRLGVVDSRGQFIPTDRILMLLASDVLTRNPGSDVIFDVKCTSHLAEEIRRAGGRPVMWRSGHTPLKARLRESGALIAGELSGHIIFQERWFGFDDAVYAGARLLEVLSLDPRTSEEIFAALPSGIVTPELGLPLEEGEPERIMQSVLRYAGELEGAELILIDGLRAEFETGWGLVRASNTQPKLTFRFEGEDQAALEGIQLGFRRLMERAAPGLALPF